MTLPLTSSVSVIEYDCELLIVDDVVYELDCEDDCVFEAVSSSVGELIVAD